MIKATTYSRLIDFALKSLKYHEPDKPYHTRSQVEERARWIASYVEAQHLMKTYGRKDMAGNIFDGCMPDLSTLENLLVWCQDFDVNWGDDPEDAQTLEHMLASYWPSYEFIVEEVEASQLPS